MGGSSKPKRESNAERNARILSAKKSNRDAAALQSESERVRRSRMRSSLFGGPESGANLLGGGTSRLGVMP